MADVPARSRSAAFPFELAYRVIQMHSLIGDTVLDPFLGTGTTTAAAIASGRSSIGFEIEDSLGRPIRDTIDTGVPVGREYAQRRLDAHLDFVQSRAASGRPCRHVNRHYGFAVVTSQETDLQFPVPRVKEAESARAFSVKHEHAPLPTRSKQIELTLEGNS